MSPQAITWNNGGLSSKWFVVLWAISQKVHISLILNMCSIITLYEYYYDITKADELTSMLLLLLVNDSGPDRWK